MVKINYKNLEGTVKDGVYVHEYFRVQKVSDTNKKYSVGYLTVALDEVREATLDVTLSQWQKWSFIDKLNELAYGTDEEEDIVLYESYTEYIQEKFKQGLAQGLKHLLDAHSIVKIYTGKNVKIHKGTIIRICEDALVSDIVSNKHFNPKELYVNKQFKEIISLYDMLTQEQQLAFDNDTFDVIAFGNELLSLYKDDEEVQEAVKEAVQEAVAL
jgi:hypothetical protein